LLTLHTSPRFAPEKEYIFHVLLREMLGVDYRVAFSEGEKNYRLCLPNGAELVVEDHFFEQKDEADYLRAEHIPNKIEWADSPFGQENFAMVFGHNLFIVKEKEARSGLDVFASAFFMLARWEEFAQPGRDVHGRSPAEKSLAARADFLHRPVVNEWADLLWQLLQRLGWESPRPQRQFRVSFSCDVDHPRLWWSAAARWKTVAGAIFRRGDFREAKYWLSLSGARRDPYDVFDAWLDFFAEKNRVAQFNFLGERPRTSDCWYPLRHPFVPLRIRLFSSANWLRCGRFRRWKSRRGGNIICGSLRPRLGARGRRRACAKTVRSATPRRRGFAAGFATTSRCSIFWRGGLCPCGKNRSWRWT
jgi:hypothetical protein